MSCLAIFLTPSGKRKSPVPVFYITIGSIPCIFNKKQAPGSFAEWRAAGLPHPPIDPAGETVSRFSPENQTYA